MWRDPSWVQRKSWVGSGSVWRAADFEQTGRYLTNNAEMLPNHSQTLTFAESYDLIHWRRTPELEKLYFPIHPELGYRSSYGRWDGIYSVPAKRPGERDGYPRLGYWTATCVHPVSKKTTGSFAMGVTHDGVHWTAFPPPKMEPGPIGAELGAVEWVPYTSGKPGGRWVALLGSGWPRTNLVYSSASAYGPFRRASANLHVLNGSCYFLRFFRGVANELLVTHQSWDRTRPQNRRVYIAPFKACHLDDMGVLRLVWWAGNERLKGPEAARPKLDRGTSRPTYFLGRLHENDLSQGFILEATVTLPSWEETDWPGFVLEQDGGRAPLAIVLTPKADEVAVGEYQHEASSAAVRWAPTGATAVPTADRNDWMLSGGAMAGKWLSKDGERRKIGALDISSGIPGSVGHVESAHAIDSAGHTLHSAHVCFRYVATHGCGPGRPTRVGATLTLALVDAVDHAPLRDVWKSEPLQNYSWDHFSRYSPRTCGGAGAMDFQHHRQIRLALIFANTACTVHIPMTDIELRIQWGSPQKGTYTLAPIPSVRRLQSSTQRWSHDVRLGRPGDSARMRLLYRANIIEFYLNDFAFMTIHTPPSNSFRVGLSSPMGTNGAVRWWPMTLPGSQTHRQQRPSILAALVRDSRPSHATAQLRHHRQRSIALPPLPPAVMQRLGEQPVTDWLRGALSKHAWSNPAQTRQWARVHASASAAGVLRIVVLGASVSNGCGVCDYDTLESDPFYGEPSEIRAARNMSSCGERVELACAQDLSWAQMMRDELAHALQPTHVHLSVRAQNAIGPAFFTECTQSKVPAETHIVLAEFSTNLWGGTAEVSRMLSRVRWAAPRAVVAFVTWMKRTECAQQRRSPIDEASVSRATPADVLHVHLALSELLAPAHALAKASCKLLYAQRTRDMVHPNPLGHRLLGAISAAFVLSQLKKARDGEGQLAHHHHSDVERPSPSPEAGEWCYDASHLPVAPDVEAGLADPASSGKTKTKSRTHSVGSTGASSWRLVDEGTPGKGIPKMGWASETVGQQLRLGPLAGPPGRQCALMRMRVGYLSKPGRHQGDLLYSCEGCTCAHEQDLTSYMQPFPRLPTDAEIAADPDLRGNFSVTVASVFLALWEVAKPCYLVITHAPRGGGERTAPGATSHVRVDSLSVHHRGVFGYAVRVLGNPRKYRSGVDFAQRLLRDCPTDCTGPWPCPLTNTTARP